MDDQNEMLWRTLGGREVTDICAEIQQLVAQGERAVHLGTDAQKRAERTDFVTVIAVLTPGQGGRLFYRRQRVTGRLSLREKLFREVWLSVDVALTLSQVLPESCAIQVHVDANENIRFKSANYVQELAGMVSGQGFAVRLKPESWCASHAADHVVKFKHARSH